MINSGSNSIKKLKIREDDFEIYSVFSPGEGGRLMRFPNFTIFFNLEALHSVCLCKSDQ